MKALLRYKAGSAYKDDGRLVYSTLARYNAIILRTKRFWCWGFPKILISVDSTQTLNKIVGEINKDSIYAVQVIKTHK